MKYLILALCIFLCASCASSANENLEFTTLFKNDADLEKNWIGNLKGYKADNGELITQPKCGHIYTEKEYQDYVLRFEFKLAPHANNGIGLRAPHPSDKSIKRHDAAYTTVELQILDDTHPKYKDLKAYQFHGSAYGIAAAKKGFLNPLGEWNYQEVRLLGTQLTVVLNGEEILNCDIAEGDAGKYAQGRNRARGHIALAGHGPGVTFRNIQVAELEAIFALPPNKQENNLAQDLSSWQGLLTRPFDRPHKRKTLSAPQLKEKQKEADKIMQKHWSINNEGDLFFDGAKGGTSLATKKKYQNFEMHVSWKIEKEGDSGIYLRGLPQVQIWDTENPKAFKHGAQKGSGGLWNNPDKMGGRWPLVKADKPVGEWNHFYIRMVGDRVSIWLNGQNTVNDAPLYNLWEKGKAPIPVQEQIELQCHGHPVWFKNIYIKELK